MNNFLLNLPNALRKAQLVINIIFFFCNLDIHFPTITDSWCAELDALGAFRCYFARYSWCSAVEHVRIQTKGITYLTILPAIVHYVHSYRIAIQFEIWATGKQLFGKFAKQGKSTISILQKKTHALYVNCSRYLIRRKKYIL